MAQTATINIHINIDKVEGKGNLYHCVMNVNEDTTPVEEDVEFPLGTVDLLQPMHALENRGLLDYVNISELGGRLYSLLFPAALGERFDRVLDSSRIGERIRVILNTHHGQIISLPWELILHPTRGYLCCDGNISLIRTLGKEFRQSQHTLEAPPLKILMMVSSPEDQPSLDFEQEQDVVQTALEPLVRKGLVDVEYSEDGTLEALEREIKADRYHVLHLSGHGGFDRPPPTPPRGGNSETEEGFFAFEDGPANAGKLLDALKGADSVKLVLLSGCVTSKTDYAALAGMAQALCDGGVPLVIGFQLSILDTVATNLIGHLYSRISEGWELDRALTDGRIEIQRFISKHEQLTKDAHAQVSWAIPTLYASSSLWKIVDFDREPVKRIEPPINFIARFRDIQYLERGFVGRRKEIRACRKILENSPCLYLHGFGGIGKSTLATKLSERFAYAHYKGLFIKGKVRVEAIVSQMAQDLLNDNQVEPYRILTSADVPSEAKLQYCINNVFVRTPYLIILDNFEDNLNDNLKLTDESLENGLATLLKGIALTPTRMIITSRYELKSQPLKPCIEQYNLGEFSSSDAIKKMNRYDSLRVQPQTTKKEIYRRLGGHPKAIEDIAAVLDTKAIKWEQLEKKLQGVEDALQADFLLLEVLYDFLKPQEQELLRRASVYTQPVSYNGLQIQVEYDIEDFISPLVHRSLLHRGYDENGEEVYYVHRITAQFLKGLTPDKEQNESHRRAAEYYDYEIRNNNMIQWNWLVAREHYLAYGELKEAAGIAIGFAEALNTWGNYESAMQLNQETVEHAPDEKIKATALHNIGIIHQLQGRYEEALRYYNDSLCINQELDNKEGIAASLGQIGIIHQLQGRYEEALWYYNDSLCIQQELDKEGIATSLHQIGIIRQLQGRYEEALRYYNNSLRIDQELGNKEGIANSFGQIGMIYEEQGKYEDALKYYNDSLRINRELSNKAGIASSLHNIGNIHLQSRYYEKALQYSNASLRIKQKLGNKEGIANSLGQIGMIYEEQGRYEDALKYYNDSLRINRELSNKAGIASSLHNIGTIHQEQGRYEDALRYVLRARIIFGSLNSPNAQIAANNLSIIRQRIGEAEFERIVETEMRKIERFGPFVI